MSMRFVIDADSLPTLKGRFSQGMAAGPLVFLAGQLASDFASGLHPDVKETPGLPSKSVAIKKQTEFVLERQQRVAKAAGVDLTRAAQTWTLLKDVGDTGLVNDVRRRFFDTKALPAASTFGVENLTVQGSRIEIDAILAGPDADREVIAFDDAQAQELSQAAAVRVDNFVFVSSLSAFDFSNGAIVGAREATEFPYFVSSVKQQTKFILERLAAVLAKAGASLDTVVKAQVFLPNLGHFAEMEEVWRDAFPNNPPARTVVPAKLTIPQCLIEINAIAIIPGGNMRKEMIQTDRAPAPSIHESQAVKAGPFVFLSQLFATDYKNGVALAAKVNPNFPNHDSDVRRQLVYIFENADTILKAGGSSIKNIVRRQGFYTTFANKLGPSRDLTGEMFSPDPPPSTTVSLGTGLLIPGCEYQFDAIGVEG
jgi:enamine deaminase RidA (YjgF/YER057c/UK114 family)